MRDRVFLDTNIFVYAFDRSAPEKRLKACSIIADENWLISWQVIQEFSNVALHRFKQPMRVNDLEAYLNLVLWPRCALFPAPEIYQKALEIHQSLQYRYYDSLMVSSALATDASILYSEDLQHGRIIGNLEIVNPFIGLNNAKN